ncbi:hypothetical protein BYT27DRAFT_7216002 [Phlegmacium glaucopus]|nr:hypothetical protein BYT27DRAFT_7216002 [Phlegmacium glaucopus]
MRIAVTHQTIPKPKGEAGRSNSSGYNLKNALGWEEEHYSEFTTFINDAVKKKLDSKRCYSKQKPADLEELVQLTVQKFNIRNVYSKDWPVLDALKLRLKCMSDAEKKKVTKKTEANFKKYSQMKIHRWNWLGADVIEVKTMGLETHVEFSAHYAGEVAGRSEVALLHLQTGPDQDDPNQCTGRRQVSPLLISFSKGNRTILPSIFMSTQPSDRVEFWGWIEQVEVRFHSPSRLEAKETWFKMCLDDIYLWKKSEELVVEAARCIQLFFGIQGNAPPTPSTFRYNCPHKSHAVTKCMISVSRDWFIVWMGFLSYLISRVKLCHHDARPPLPASPLPDWYNLLRNKNNYANSWLDGLSSSTVCSFNLRTLRAGIVFRWVDKEECRPQIEWFYHHHVPLWFTWTCTEEQAIRSDHRLSYLEPPVEMVQQALMLLFSSPNLPLAGLIMKKYFKLGNDPITNETLDLLRLEHAPSSVFQITVWIFINQTSAILRMETSASKDLKLLVES